jgi:hypothetical protein
MEQVRVVAEICSEIAQYLVPALIFELLAGASFWAFVPNSAISIDWSLD